MASASVSECHTHPQRSLSLLLHPQCLHSLLLHPQCLHSLFVHHWCLRSQPNLLSDNASMVTLPKYRPLWPLTRKLLGLLNRSSIMSPPVCWKLLQRVLVQCQEIPLLSIDHLQLNERVFSFHHTHMGNISPVATHLLALTAC